VLTCKLFVSLLAISELTWHVVTLRPSNIQASVGFQQCMAALKDMEVRFTLNLGRVAV
jgi:hypothetical protein